jgi:biopolymer transport protein ExbB/TolQ
MDGSDLVCSNGRTTSPSIAHSAPDGDKAHEIISAAPLSVKSKGRRALLWGIGSTLLSGVGFIGLALFDQYNSMAGELRSDLKHFNETASEYVKREHFQRFRDQVKERLKEMQEVAQAKARMEQELRVSEAARADMSHEMQRLRERLAFLEGRQTTLLNAQAQASPNK